MLLLPMAPLIYSHGTIRLNDMTVPCWVCGGTISRQAKVCPHCGQPDPAAESIKRFDERRKQEDYAAVERSKNRREAVPLQVVTWLGVIGLFLVMWLFVSFM